jgi:hypothetical protein
MRKLIHSFVILTGFFLIPGHLMAQNLYVLENNGQQSAYVTDDIGKLVFSSGELIVEMMEGTSDNYLLADLRYLNFTDLVQVPEKGPADYPDMMLYPNPAKGTLYVDFDLPDKETVTLEIISVTGMLVIVKTFQYEKGRMAIKADISALTQGLYLCRLTGNKTMITRKFIKN